MQSIIYHRPTDVPSTLRLLRDGGKCIGGGTNLLDLMKAGVEPTGALVDINHLPGLADIAALPDGGLRIGALARNSDTAVHPLVRSRYPLLSQALLAGASPQLRNMATVGGNLMQRTRCPYFTDPAFDMCNKRQPGSGCGALEGFNRTHAILGASPACIAVHPSDMCVALLALDAQVQVQGPNGQRAIPMTVFHRLPGSEPQHDTTLAAGELILSVDLPAQAFARHAHYLKMRDRASYAFALVSVAAALDIDGGNVRQARIALGGVAHKPWRDLAAERLLVGQRLSAANCEAAANAILGGALAYRGNGYKVALAHRAIVHALRMAEQTA